MPEVQLFRHKEHSSHKIDIFGIINEFLHALEKILRICCSTKRSAEKTFVVSRNSAVLRSEFNASVIIRSNEQKRSTESTYVFPTHAWYCEKNS